jgi:hypothetical protein
MSTARWARIGFALLAWLVFASTLIQVYLAGNGVFNSLGGSGTFATQQFDPHRNFALLIFVLMIAQLVLAFAGRLGWRMIGASALLLLLLIAQSVLIRVGSPSIAALHPVNGFAIVLVGLWTAWRSLGYIRAPLPPEPVRPLPAPVAPPSSPSGKPDTEDEQ